MANVAELQTMIGRTAVAPDGSKIGKIGQIYLDDQTGQPQWVTVSTGLFGTKESFAPLQGSSLKGDDLMLTVDKDIVKGAPNVDADGHLAENENDALYDYYSGRLTGADYQTGTQGTERIAADHQSPNTDSARTVGHDTSGPNTDEAMTRSEEQMRVGTERVEAGRARLRKFIVTENVTTTVPVSHEEVRIVREPITDANRGQAMAGGDLTEEEHEVTLHAERAVVTTETVPVERIRLETETVTEQQTVTGQVRKEQIEQVEGTEGIDPTIDPKLKR